MERSDAYQFVSRAHSFSKDEYPKPHDNVDQYVSRLSTWHCQSVQQMLLHRDTDGWVSALERRTDSEMQQIRRELAETEKRKEVEYE